MQQKYRLYHRSNRPNGTFYAQKYDTGARESLGTKNRTAAIKLLQAKNDSHAQPVLSGVGEGLLAGTGPPVWGKDLRACGQADRFSLRRQDKGQISKIPTKCPVKRLMNTRACAKPFAGPRGQASV